MLQYAPFDYEIHALCRRPPKWPQFLILRNSTFQNNASTLLITVLRGVFAPHPNDRLKFYTLSSLATYLQRFSEHQNTRTSLYRIYDLQARQEAQ